MKKNAMLKIAAILLVAVLLTTCAISATFAKYTTTDALDEAVSARVARWGVVASVTAEGDVFKEAYQLGGNTVVASLEDDTVLAPGTSSEGYLKFDVSFKDDKAPEVAYEIVPVVTVEIDGWGNYFPVQFIVTCGEDSTTVANIAGATSETLSAALTAAVKGYLADAENAAAAAEKTVTISWQWPFETTVDGQLSDANDSALGDAASAEISITGSLTVTQIGSTTEYAK